MNKYQRNEAEERQMNKESAARFNKGKTRYDLLPAWATEQLALVYTYGTRKYSDDNYLKGMKWRKDVLGCIFRHLWKWIRGEQFDAESNLHHLSHAAWNCFCLMTYERNGIGQDDRHPYDLDLLPPEEQTARIDVWTELAKQGKEDEYNGLEVVKYEPDGAFIDIKRCDNKSSCKRCIEEKKDVGENPICSDCIR